MFPLGNYQRNMVVIFYWSFKEYLFTAWAILFDFINPTNFRRTINVIVERNTVTLQDTALMYKNP